MNIFHIKHSLITFLFLSLVSFSGLIAQDGRVSEEEINTQKLFIDANREKLLGNYEEASYLYKEVLKRDQQNHAAAYELARVYDVLDKDSKALQSIKMAVALDAKNMWYQLFLADMQEKLGAFEEAAVIYEELIKGGASNTYYLYTQWTYYLIKNNEVPKAIKAFDQLEKKIGISEDVISKKYALYAQLGNDKKALAELEKLTNYYPSETRHLHRVAQFHKDKKNKAKAVEVYKKILSIDPEDVKATIELAGTSEQGSDDVTYLNSLKPVFNNPEVDIDIKIKELIPFVEKIANGDKDKALTTTTIELAESIENIHPNEAKTFALYGDILFHTGDEKMALEKYQQSLSLNKNIYSVWEHVMDLHAANNNMDALAKVSEEAMDLFPNKAKAYYFYGLASNATGNYMDAINAFQQATIMTSKMPKLKAELLRRTAESWTGLKKLDKAEKAYNDALAISPKDINIMSSYSLFLSDTEKDLPKAKVIADAASKLKPGFPPAQDAMGWFFYKKKKFKDAEKWLSKAINNGGDSSPVIAEHYGDVLFQLNQVDDAILYWKKALENGSHSEMLKKKIAEKGIQK